MKNIKRQFPALSLAVVAMLVTLNAQPTTAVAQGTAFTYQGRLNAGSSAATGIYDLRFVVYDALSSGNLIAGPLTNSATSVSNGLFTVALDFGGGVFTGPARWLEIAARTNGTPTFTTLAPRQPVLPAPYSVMANSASNLLGTLPAAKLSGTIPAANLNAIPNGSLANSSLTVNAGSGLTGGGGVALGGSTSLNLDTGHPNNWTAAQNFSAALTIGSPSQDPNGNLFLQATDTSWMRFNPSFVNFSYNGIVQAGDQGIIFNGITNSGSGSGNFVIAPWWAGTSGIRITGNGNVGIGTASPQATLDVNGAVKANNLTLTGNLYLPATSASQGIIYSGGSPFIHAYGGNNFFAGPNAGNLTMSGGVNTGIGYDALMNNTTGNYNTANGENALLSNQTGSFNTANGVATLYHNTASRNTANGYVALYNNMSGSENTANGFGALYFNTTGSNNTANGSQALYGNTTSSYNTANGWEALYKNGANMNTANGCQALFNNTSGYRNVANGFNALYSNTSGSGNVADGGMALYNNISGCGHTAIGDYALYGNTTGWENTAIGDLTLWMNQKGSNNIALGYMAGYYPTNSYNIDIGNSGVDSDTGIIRIGDSSVHTATYLAGNVGWGTASSLGTGQGGCIELGDSTQAGATPYFDFHYGTGSAQDFNVRLINNADNVLTINRAGSGVPMAIFASSGLTVNGTFVSSSDRNRKEHFQAVDPQTVLDKVAALPISHWNFKDDPATPHLGPMAQDFYAAFHVGPDDTHITTVDEGGVALAAIQGLNQKVEAQLKAKDAEIQDLKQSVAELKALVEKLAGN